MAISLLKVSNLRNVSDLTIEPFSGINMFWGDNGSGKTTILEAIFLSARGRSFRGRRAGSLIKYGEDSLSVFSQSHSAHIDHKVGIQKRKSETEVRYNGSKLNKLSHLARITPLQIITPSSHEIIERGPEYRRRFLEWGVFHVEHDYPILYSALVKALLNRNAALRLSQEQLSTWDLIFIECAEKLENMRECYFRDFSKQVLVECNYFLPDDEIKIGWNRGWNEKSDLKQILRDNLEKDRERGFTHAGPHRADMTIKFNGKSAKDAASRGQQKLLVICMHLAQAHLTYSSTGNSPLLLIDDLASELDQRNRKLLLERLSEIGAQVFMSGTDPIDDERIKLFHVEHGTIV